MNKKWALASASFILGIVQVAGAQTIETYAGGAAFHNAPPLSIATSPGALALGPDGSLYVVDGENHIVIRLDPASNLASVVAGYGGGGFSDRSTNAPSSVGDGGAATKAWLSGPYGVAVDPSGNLLIADYTRIRRVDRNTGIITTVAGNGSATSYYSGEGGPATLATISAYSVVVDATGNIFIANAFRVLRVDASTGVITTVAGIGQAASAGDGGLAVNAAVNPTALAVDAADNIFLIDSGCTCVRRVDAATGVIDIVPMNAGPTEPIALAIDADGNVYVSDATDNVVYRIDVATGDTEPAVGSNGLARPTGIALDAQGNLYVSDSHNFKVRRIARLTGTITTVMGSGADPISFGDGLPATAGSLLEPWGIVTDASGNVYFTEQHKVRRIDATTHLLSTIAGTDDYSGESSGDGGPATSAKISFARALAVDAHGNLFFGDQDYLRRIDAGTGVISRVAGGCCADDGGLAVDAPLDGLSAVAVDTAGNIFVAEFGSLQRIRRIDAVTGIIQTIAGNGNTGYGGDGGAAIDATFNAPNDLALDPAGNLYITDSGNNRIRRIDSTTGVISTVAGTGAAASSGDGGLASAAGIGPYPAAIAFDSAGNMYLVSGDSAGVYRVRRVDAGTRVISTVAGAGTSFNGFPWDSGPAASADIGYPWGIVVGPDGNLYMTDAKNFLIRRVTGLASASDTTPPTISPSVSGIVGSNGWYTGDVSVTWSVTDGESAVSSSTGCDPSTVTVDTVGQSFACTATSAGGTATQTVVVKRDTTAPAAAATATPVPNTNRWNSGNVTVHVTGTDATSGIASCTADKVLSAEGGDQSASGTCMDNAGNVSASASVSGINIDKTAPLVSASAAPVANGGGWNITTVTVSFSAVDALSGVAVNGCDAPVTLSTSGSGQSATGSCQDLAGNSGSATVTSINIDRSAPVATATPTPAPNANGWNNTDVVVSFSGTDSLSGSGLASCSPDVTLSAEGTGLSASGTCSDVAGNTSAAATATANIDKTAPTAIVVTPAASGSYVQDSSVNANYSCADSLSGLASCIGAVANGGAIDTSAVGTRNFAVTATDAAGNASTQTVAYEIAGVDGTVPATGGTVSDTNSGLPAPAVLTVPAGVLSQSTQVAISVQTTPPDVPLPSGIVATGSYFVSVDLNPLPTFPLPSPGLTVTLPLTSPGTPSSPLDLYSYDPVQNQLVPALDTSGQPIVGIVNADGLSATFTGVSHFSMVVGLVPPPAAPLITPVLSGTLGANGWYTSNVSLTWTIASSTTVTSKTGCDARTITVNTGPAGLSYSCTATNGTGTTSRSVTVKKDATAPVVAAVATPLPNLAGWRNAAVTVRLVGEDLQSGVANCTPAVVLVTQGVGQSASGRCTNNAGLLSALATASGIKIDLTAPTVTITSPANGAVYARNAVVRASYACSDALSGVAICSGTVANGVKIDTATRGTKTFQVTGRDAAGNIKQTTYSYAVQ